MSGWFLHLVEALVVLVLIWAVLRLGSALTQLIAPDDVVQVPGVSRLALLAGALVGLAMLLHPARPGLFSPSLVFDADGPWDVGAAGLLWLALGTGRGALAPGAGLWLLLAAGLALLAALLLCRLWSGRARLRAGVAVLIWRALTAAFVIAGAHVLAWLLHSMNVLALFLALYGWQRWRYRR
jgi:hypothetical protein